MWLDVEAEIASNLGDFVSCLFEADAFAMFTIPSLTDKQVLTWLQAEPHRSYNHCQSNTTYLALGAQTW